MQSYLSRFLLLFALGIRLISLTGCGRCWRLARGIWAAIDRGARRNSLRRRHIISLLWCTHLGWLLSLRLVHHRRLAWWPLRPITIGYPALLLHSCQSVHLLLSVRVEMGTIVWRMRARRRPHEGAIHFIHNFHLRIHLGRHLTIGKVHRRRRTSVWRHASVRHWRTR